MIVRKIMNGNCICDRLTDGQRNGEETKSPLRLAGWGLKMKSVDKFNSLWEQWKALLEI